MNGSTRNNLILFLVFSLFLVSCHLPAADPLPPAETERTVLWDLSIPSELIPREPVVESQPQFRPTSTPQLYKSVDFDGAFAAAKPLTAADPVSHFTGGGADSAQWLYFEPAEYSSQQTDTLYAAFRNSGERVWDERYSLEFFAGNDPTGGKIVRLDQEAAPEGQAVFRIPIQSTDPSWKACWHLKNGDGETIYEFCYNHGNGENISPAKPAQNSSSGSSGSSSSGTFWGFVKKSGKAPAKVSTEELSAEFVSSSPATQHTFKAYDHVEDFSVSFKNNGTAVWDASYSLKFYSGYNWFHTESVSLGQTVGQGETATFTMPMEIIEDNDKWVTCWYLATPDGQNLSDFCFNYYTRS